MANSLAVPAIDSQPPRLLLTRAETLAALRIGETTLHWLARTEKLNAVKIGARVLFSAAEVERLARRGCSLTEAEKRAATRRREDPAERANPGKWEDQPSAAAAEVDNRKRDLDAEGV
jgi:Helix-turn-helix domain